MRYRFFVLAIILLIVPGNFTWADDPRPADQQAGAIIEKDIPYGQGGDAQKLDLYLPAQKGFTTIVFTYGGGWHAGTRKAVGPIGKKFQGLGFGCALLSHRLAPKDRFPAQIEDVAAGFAWVQKHIAEKGGDPKRIFVMGHSSGGHLSVLLASDPQYLAKHGLHLADIAGVVGLSAILDLEPRKDGKGFGDVMLANPRMDVFARDAASLRQASPIQHVSKSLPPTLLIVGENDFPMLEGDSHAFVDKAQSAGASARMYVAKGRDHQMVVLALLKDRDPVMEEVVGFLKKVTAEP